MPVPKLRPNTAIDGPRIAENISTILTYKRIPKMRFYKACGITASAFSQWKTGLTVPTLGKLNVIAEYLDVPLHELMGKKINPAESTSRVSDDDLTLDEKTVIEYFRRATPEQRQALAIFLKLNGSPGAGPGAPSKGE